VGKTLQKMQIFMQIFGIEQSFRQVVEIVQTLATFCPKLGLHLMKK
jgi:hypothetical protein